MASITKTVDAAGAAVYKVQVSGGRGRRVKRSWRPQAGWSARTIEQMCIRDSAHSVLDFVRYGLLLRLQRGDLLRKGCVLVLSLIHIFIKCQW